MCHILALRLIRASDGPVIDRVDYDQTAYNVRSDHESLLSDKKIFFSKNKKNKLEGDFICFFISISPVPEMFTKDSFVSR